MKLATPSELKKVTGFDDPVEQLRVLREMGCNPIFTLGKVRIYQEVIAQAMLTNRQQSRPSLNLG